MMRRKSRGGTLRFLALLFTAAYCRSPDDSLQLATAQHHQPRRLDLPRRDRWCRCSRHTRRVRVIKRHNTHCTSINERQQRSMQQTEKTKHSRRTCAWLFAHYVIRFALARRMRMMDKFLRTTFPSSIALVNDGGVNERDGVGVCRILQVPMRYTSAIARTGRRCGWTPVTVSGLPIEARLPIGYWEVGPGEPYIEGTGPIIMALSSEIRS